MRSYRTHLFGMSMMAAIALVSGAARAAIFTVNTTTDAVDVTPGDGVCRTAANECSLRASIQEANALAGDDDIILPAGTLTLTIVGPTEDLSANGDLNPRSNIHIEGQGANSTIIASSTGESVFRMPFGVASDVFIAGVTISGGSQTNGGGILTQAGGGSLELYRCYMTTNTATVGNGGAIYSSRPLVVRECTFATNTAFFDGGAIFNLAAATVQNCTISGNAAGRFGGGWSNFAGTVNMTNTTIANNTADSDANGVGDGGGLFMAGGAINMNNTLIGDNVDRGGQSPDVTGIINSQGFNLVENPAGATFNGITATNILNQDPKLGPLALNGGPTQTQALLVGSPAIDTGNSALTSDQRGHARAGTASDIGAFEFDPPADTDADGVPDSTDNCPNVANPTQVDSNANGVGDACELPPSGQGTGNGPGTGPGTGQGNGQGNQQQHNDVPLAPVGCGAGAVEAGLASMAIGMFWMFGSTRRRKF